MNTTAKCPVCASAILNTGLLAGTMNIFLPKKNICTSIVGPAEVFTLILFPLMN